MATSAADRTLVVSAFDSAYFPGGVPTLETAWLGIYQVLWWYHSRLEGLNALVVDAPADVRHAAAILRGVPRNDGSASSPAHPRGKRPG